MKYEFLTGTVDPYSVQTQLFCCDLLTIDDLIDIHEVYEESGRKCACEKMLTLMFRTWKGNYLDQFIQVLDDCGYKECAKQICGKYLAESTCMFYCFTHIFPALLLPSLPPSSFPFFLPLYCLTLSLTPFSLFFPPPLSSPCN